MTATATAAATDPATTAVHHYYYSKLVTTTSTPISTDPITAGTMADDANSNCSDNDDKAMYSNNTGSSTAAGRQSVDT